MALMLFGRQITLISAHIRNMQPAQTFSPKVPSLRIFTAADAEASIPFPQAAKVGNFGLEDALLEGQTGFFGSFDVAFTTGAPQLPLVR